MSVGSARPHDVLEPYWRIDAVHSGGFDKDVDGGGLAALLAFDGVLSARSGHAHQGLRPVMQAGQNVFLLRSFLLTARYRWLIRTKCEQCPVMDCS